jgi:hypothetical protein
VLYKNVLGALTPVPDRNGGVLVLGDVDRVVTQDTVFRTFGLVAIDVAVGGEGGERV